MTEENIDNLVTALIEMGAVVEKNGKHIQATFTNPDIKVASGKDNLVIRSSDTSINPADYEYKIFGNTGDIGKGKKIMTLSPIDFQ